MFSSGLLPRVVLAVGLMGATAARDAEPDAAVEIGEQVPDLEFKDIHYLPRTLDDLGTKRACVIVFVTTTCPLVNRYLPELVRIEREYRDRDVRFLALNVGADDTIVDAAAQAVEAGAEFPVGKDRDGRCARVLGVERTPGAAVLDARGRLVYRGRIDDQYRLGGSRPEPSRRDLRQALDDVLASRDVTVKDTSVDGCLITPETIPAAHPRVTFTEQVAPILQEHCQGCHRAGGDAPFALVSYRDVASQAAMIAEVVADRSMPPWFASRHHGEIADPKTLADGDRQTILEWIRGGLARGDPARRPPPRKAPAGKWRIGEPDLVITTPFAQALPADGYLDYKFTVLPHIFVDDTWVQAIEILPDNPAVVHHCNMAFVTAGEGYKEQNFLTGRVPGGDPMVLDDGLAILIPKGSVLGLQIHYVTTGKKERVKIAVGLRFPRRRVHKRLIHQQVYTNRFQIPPHAPAHRVSAARRLDFEAVGVGLFAHMHLRGKDMTFLARDPAGAVETLLLIPNYSFDWQQSYRWRPGAKMFAKGTMFEVVAHFDNSAFNPYNPDPQATVTPGDQTFQEMMYGFFFYTRADEDLNLSVDPQTGRARL